MNTRFSTIEHVSNIELATTPAYWIDTGSKHLQTGDLVRRTSNQLHENVGMSYGLALENFAKGAWVKMFPQSVVISGKKGTSHLSPLTNN